MAHSSGDPSNEIENELPTLIKTFDDSVEIEEY